uniref:Uncharacterized protein n=1 Tax=Acrobeloides nanus TaxID=290746 RepID=A0A914DJQ5_9BILA
MPNMAIAVSIASGGIKMSNMPIFKRSTNRKNEYLGQTIPSICDPFHRRSFRISACCILLLAMHHPYFILVEYRSLEWFVPRDVWCLKEANVKDHLEFFIV